MKTQSIVRNYESWVATAYQSGDRRVQRENSRTGQTPGRIEGAINVPRIAPTASLFPIPASRSDPRRPLVPLMADTSGCGCFRENFGSNSLNFPHYDNAVRVGGFIGQPPTRTLE